MQSIVTVSRTISTGGTSIIETASAPLPDDLALDASTEAVRRHALAYALFCSLPQLQPKSPPCPPPPPNRLN